MFSALLKERDDEMQSITRNDIISASKPKSSVIQVNHGKASKKIKVTRYAAGPITNTYGKFMLYEFRLSDKWKDYEVLASAKQFDNKLMPVFDKSKTIYLKTDSGCRSGEIYLDNTCTCRQQLLKSMEIIGKHGSGLLVTIPNQEGRGHGFARKYATLGLQEYFGYDTYTAAKVVNKKVDIRDYYGVVAILKFFGIKSNASISVIANNLSKLKELEENGYKPKLKPLEIEADENTIKHLKAKKEHLGEIISV